MKYIVITLFLVGVVADTTAQQDQHQRAIINAFEEYRKAFLSVDRAALTEFEHPEIVEKGGGKTYYYEEVTDQYNMYGAGGLEIKDLQMKQSSKVVSAGDHLQAMVPYERTFGTSGKDHVEQGFFLATSMDKGTTWYFTDMRKYDAESIKVFLTNYNDRLNIYLSK